MSLTKVTYSMIQGAVVNALDFGATGNGSTNDTAAIQAAINSFGAGTSWALNTGGTVFLPKGIYKVTNLTLPNGISLVGEGKQLTIIKGVGTSGYTISSTEFAGGTRSYQTNIKGMQINGDPSLPIISGGTVNSSCGGIYLPSSIGLIVQDVFIMYFTVGIKLATTQDSQFINVESLFNNVNLDIGYYGSDTSNALHFESCRFAYPTASGSQISVKIDGTSASQCRDIAFNNTVFEGGYVSLTRCDGIKFVNSAFTCQIADNHMVSVFDSASIDTKDIVFSGCYFNSSYNKTARAISATNTTSPVTVTGCAATTLTGNTFAGNINVTGLTAYDMRVPIALLWDSCKYTANNANALTVPALAPNDANGYTGEVAYSTQRSAYQVLDYSAGAYVGQSSITHNTWYRNNYGQDLIVTAYFKVISAASPGTSNCSISLASYTTSSTVSSPTIAIPNNSSTLNTIIPHSFRVRAGEYFQVVCADTSKINCVGAMLS